MTSNIVEQILWNVRHPSSALSRRNNNYPLLSPLGPASYGRARERCNALVHLYAQRGSGRPNGVTDGYNTTTSYTDGDQVARPRTRSSIILPGVLYSIIKRVFVMYLRFYPRVIRSWFLVERDDSMKHFLHSASHKF